MIPKEEAEGEDGGTKSEKIAPRPPKNGMEGELEEEKQRDSAAPEAAPIEKRDLGMSVEKMTPSAGGVAADNRSFLQQIDCIQNQEENRDRKQFTQ